MREIEFELILGPSAATLAQSGLVWTMTLAAAPGAAIASPTGRRSLRCARLAPNDETMAAFHGGAEIDSLSRRHARQAEAAGACTGARPASWRDVAEGMVRAVGFQL
jgi:hypothetical protein